jgi:hypothetical protein
VILKLISDKNYHLPVNYKFLSVITCNTYFKTFISNKICHLSVNYKFLLVLTCNSDFKFFINKKLSSPHINFYHYHLPWIIIFYQAISPWYNCIYPGAEAQGGQGVAVVPPTSLNFFYRVLVIWYLVFFYRWWLS